MTGLSFKTTARVAGWVYVAVFVTGIAALLARGRAAMIAGIAAAACYFVVTLLFYLLFKRVDQPLSLVAAAVSMAGITIGGRVLHPLVFFGVYCLLIGWLIVKSTFLPRVLGYLMMFASVGWFTFASPALARLLYPYNLAPGILGEGALTLWLVVVGVRAASQPESQLAA